MHLSEVALDTWNALWWKIWSLRVTQTQICCAMEALAPPLIRTSQPRHRLIAKRSLTHTQLNLSRIPGRLHFFKLERQNFGYRIYRPWIIFYSGDGKYRPQNGLSGYFRYNFVEISSGRRAKLKKWPIFWPWWERK